MSRFMACPGLGIAGPSRITTGKRLIHTTRPRSPAKTPTRRPVAPRTPSNPTSPAPSRLRPSHASTRNTPTPSSELERPWLEIPSSVKGVRTEERVIFARPFEDSRWGGSKAFLPTCGVAVLIYAGGFTFYKWANWDRPKDDRTYEGWWEKWSINLVDFLGPAGALVLGSMFISVARKQFKIVTRLSQVRVTPIDPASKQTSKTVIRLVHGRHQYHMSIFPKYRDIEPQNIRIFSLPGEAIRLDIVAPDPKPSQNYWLWLGDSPLLEESTDEVIISLRRIVETFGSIRPMTHEEQLAELNQRALIKTVDRIFGYKIPSRDIKDVSDTTPR